MSSFAVFLSDIHLVDKEDPKTEKLNDFLEKLYATDCSHLVLLGDIFDLWISDHKYLLNEYKNLIQSIQKLIQKGVQVHYFEGNHDLYLKDFWQNKLGAFVHNDYLEVNWFGKDLRMEHGDLANPEDKAYLLLRSFLRKSPVRMFFSNIPGAIVKKIGEKASDKSRNYTDTFNIDSRQVIRDYALKLADKSDYDVLITGHTHQKDDYEFQHNNKSRRSINLGSWFSNDITYLKMDENGLAFLNISEI